MMIAALHSHRLHRLPAFPLWLGMPLATASAAVSAQSSVSNAITVTPDNFVRAESDTYFAQNVKRVPIGTFGFNRIARLHENLHVQPAVQAINADAHIVPVPS